ncbi:MAG: alpha/beta hydrolase family protein [Acidobacteriota bacterium]
MFLYLLCFSFLTLSTVALSPQSPLLTAADVLDFPSPPADARRYYGSDPLQFGDLRLPPGPGPHPVAIIIHGGCWLAEYDIGHIGKMAAALTSSSIATWTLEYRRVGDAGGGWPGTFLDIARGADYVRVLKRDYPLDLGRVLAVGHSAGGHLALWLAGRASIAEGSPIYLADPIPVTGVLGLAAAADLAMVEKSGSCGHVIDAFMGGSPLQFPDRYQQGSPAQMVPLGVPQLLINGARDTVWGPVAESYYRKARKAGDAVELEVAPESGHFELIDPDSSTWPQVRKAAWSLLGRPASR